MSDILDLVREAARIRLLFLPHAVRQMSRPDRLITVAEVERCIFTGEVIEDYTEDVRGRSCLMFRMPDSGQPTHVVCAPKDGYLAIITAYRPDPNEWMADWKTRRSL